MVILTADIICINGWTRFMCIHLTITHRDSGFRGIHLVWGSSRLVGCWGGLFGCWGVGCTVLVGKHDSLLARVRHLIPNNLIIASEGLPDRLGKSRTAGCKATAGSSSCIDGYRPKLSIKVNVFIASIIIVIIVKVSRGVKVM